MNINESLTLLGGISPAAFMRQYWQKKPLIIRQALPGYLPPVGRADLVEMAASSEVESRLVVQPDTTTGRAWQFRQGPFRRRSLPAFKRPGWTLLVQGVDLHDERVHALLQRFRFIPDARLDDVMISYATDQGGVGPHFDSYDVFLLQSHGQRRWQIGRQHNLDLVPGMPLKILANFEPELEMVLNPGDMLYLPPRYAHNGIAQGECMTYSIGFRSPSRGELATELLHRLAEAAYDGGCAGLYKDARQVAVGDPGAIPEEMIAFAHSALEHALKNPLAVSCALGEYLTDLKAMVFFESENTTGLPDISGVIIADRCTRIMYDSHHIYINGESFLAAGRDAQLMRSLANHRRLDPRDTRRLSKAARGLVAEWVKAGWLYVQP